jgi:RNAse (barnase) inhibitor barstar
MTEDATALESRLLQNGCVVLYYSPFKMEAHADLLSSIGWRFKEVLVAESGTQEEFYDQLSLMLDFPSYFGRNLNAFRDCLGEITFPESGRLALQLLRFDAVARRDAGFAHAVLDILAESERHWLMQGRRVLFIVQSSDPGLNFPAVGSSPVLWNFEERMDSARKRA